jgi:hypothetical protein
MHMTIGQPICNERKLKSLQRIQLQISFFNFANDPFSAALP